jgi:carboxyl-terminal processing protease
VIYQYVLTYSDRERAKLSSFKNYQELYAYLSKQPLVEDFANFAETKGIQKRPGLIQISYQLLKQQLEAYIIRNFFDNNGFYPIFLKDDVALKKAVEVIKDGYWDPKRK